MNDDFLHNLRRDPPREFATRLKSRLDRQRAGGLERQRPSLFRGFALALLLGGAVSAIAAVSVYGVPSAVLDLLRAPPRAAQGLTASEPAESPTTNGAGNSASSDERAARKAARLRAPVVAKPADSPGADGAAADAPVPPTNVPATGDSDDEADDSCADRSGLSCSPGGRDGASAGSAP